tara:strand:- start:771 stop:5024 length:4254 start_codon:yes stop_codon:yes gene_type:complete
MKSDSIVTYWAKNVSIKANYGEEFKFVLNIKDENGNEYVFPDSHKAFFGVYKEIPFSQSSGNVIPVTPGEEGEAGSGYVTENNGAPLQLTVSAGYYTFPTEIVGGKLVINTKSAGANAAPNDDPNLFATPGRYKYILYTYDEDDAAASWVAQAPPVTEPGSDPEPNSFLHVGYLHPDSTSVYTLNPTELGGLGYYHEWYLLPGDTPIEPLPGEEGYTGIPLGGYCTMGEPATVYANTLQGATPTSLASSIYTFPFSLATYYSDTANVWKGSSFLYKDGMNELNVSVGVQQENITRCVWPLAEVISQSLSASWYNASVQFSISAGKPQHMLDFQINQPNLQLYSETPLEDVLDYITGTENTNNSGVPYVYSDISGSTGIQGFMSTSEFNWNNLIVPGNLTPGIEFLTPSVNSILGNPSTWEDTYIPYIANDSWTGEGISGNSDWGKVIWPLGTNFYLTHPSDKTYEAAVWQATWRAQNPYNAAGNQIFGFNAGGQFGFITNASLPTDMFWIPRVTYGQEWREDSLNSDAGTGQAIGGWTGMEQNEIAGIGNLLAWYSPGMFWGTGSSDSPSSSAFVGFVPWTFDEAVQMGASDPVGYFNSLINQAFPEFPYYDFSADYDSNDYTYVSGDYPNDLNNPETKFVVRLMASIVNANPMEVWNGATVSEYADAVSNDENFVNVRFTFVCDDGTTVVENFPTHMTPVWYSAAIENGGEIAESLTEFYGDDMTGAVLAPGVSIPTPAANDPMNNVFFYKEDIPINLDARYNLNNMFCGIQDKKGYLKVEFTNLMSTLPVINWDSVETVSSSVTSVQEVTTPTWQIVGYENEIVGYNTPTNLETQYEEIDASITNIYQTFGVSPTVVVQKTIDNGDGPTNVSGYIPVHLNGILESGTDLEWPDNSIVWNPGMYGETLRFKYYQQVKNRTVSVYGAHMGYAESSSLYWNMKINYAHPTDPDGLGISSYTIYGEFVVILENITTGETLQAGGSNANDFTFYYDDFFNSNNAQQQAQAENGYWPRKTYESHNNYPSVGQPYDWPSYVPVHTDNAWFTIIFDWPEGWASEGDIITFKIDYGYFQSRKMGGIESFEQNAILNEGVDAAETSIGTTNANTLIEMNVAPNSTMSDSIPWYLQTYGNLANAQVYHNENEVNYNNIILTTGSGQVTEGGVDTVNLSEYGPNWPDMVFHLPYCYEDTRIYGRIISFDFSWTNEVQVEVEGEPEPIFEEVAQYDYVDVVTYEEVTTTEYNDVTTTNVYGEDHSHLLNLRIDLIDVQMMDLVAQVSSEDYVSQEADDLGITEFPYNFSLIHKDTGFIVQQWQKTAIIDPGALNYNILSETLDLSSLGMSHNNEYEITIVPAEEYRRWWNHKEGFIRLTSTDISAAWKNFSYLSGDVMPNIATKLNYWMFGDFIINNNTNSFIYEGSN